MKILIRVLKWTAWEMTPPEPYGTFHLVFWLTGLALVFFAAFFLRKTQRGPWAEPADPVGGKRRLDATARVV